MGRGREGRGYSGMGTGWERWEGGRGDGNGEEGSKGEKWEGRVRVRE